MFYKRAYLVYGELYLKQTKQTFPRLFYLLDLDPDLHMSMRIRIQEAFPYEDPCGSGSETLNQIIGIEHH